MHVAFVLFQATFPHRRHAPTVSAVQLLPVRLYNALKNPFNIMVCLLAWKHLAQIANC